MKKVLSVILAAIMVFSCFGVMTNAAGSSVSDATSLSFNYTYNGSLSSSSSKEFYTFTLDASSSVKITFSTPLDFAALRIYDINGETVWDSGMINHGSDAAEIVYDETIDLTYGKYYLAVYNLTFGADAKYKLTVSQKKAGETYVEPNGGNNNTIKTADSASLNKMYYGQIAKNDGKDFYRFAISKGNVTINFTHNIYAVGLFVYSADGTQVWSSGTLSNSGGVDKKSTYSKEITLNAGTYYFAIVRSSTYSGNYSFEIKGTPATAENNPSGIDLSVSKTAMTIRKGETATAVFNYTGTYSKGMKAIYDIGDDNIISIAWGAWDKELHIPVTITGLKEGTTKFTVFLVDAETNDELDSATIEITVVANEIKDPVKPEEPEKPTPPEEPTTPDEPEEPQETIDFNDFGIDDVIIIIKWIVKVIRYVVDLISQSQT